MQKQPNNNALTTTNIEHVSKHTAMQWELQSNTLKNVECAQNTTGK